MARKSIKDEKLRLLLDWMVEAAHNNVEIVISDDFGKCGLTVTKARWNHANQKMEYGAHKHFSAETLDELIDNMHEWIIMADWSTSFEPLFTETPTSD